MPSTKTKLKKPKEEEFLRIKREDVFTVGKGQRGEYILLLDGKAMTENEIKNLQEDIKFIEKSKLWVIYTETLKNAAIEKAMYKSTSYDDMRNGKEVLEVIKLLKEINVYIRAWKPLPPLRQIPNNPIAH